MQSKASQRAIDGRVGGWFDAGMSGLPEAGEGSAVGAGGVVLRDHAESRWLCFAEPRDIVKAARIEEVLPALTRIEAAAAGGLWAAGFVAYEAAPAFDTALTVRPDAEGFPLLWFGLYDLPRTISPPAPVSDPVSQPTWSPSVNETDYRSALSRIRAHIRAGDTYQVNYTFRLGAPFAISPWAAFRQLWAAQEAPYAAYVDTGDWAIASASPELFFTLDGETIVSKPMKGTAARGLTTAADRAAAEALRVSEKERAENVMIVDMVRNDLGRIAVDGSVHVPALFDVERYPTVWQMTSTVAARTRAGVAEVFGALFPPASITGAPKVETMRLIARLEGTPRRVYTGAIGYVAPGRRMQFNVAIRTIAADRRKGCAEYGVGSGIVWDADAGREWAECVTKARVLGPPPPAFRLLETLLWTPGGGFALLERHLRRLADSAEYFGFRIEEARVRGRLEESSRKWPAVPQRVRLLVSREGDVTVEAVELKPGGPARVTLADAPVDSRDPFLYHKTTHRTVYERARASRPGYDDVLLFNERGEITESTLANVAVELDGRLFTPPVSCGLLAGTQRAEMLARGELSERIVTVDELRRASNVWLLNSVRGLWPIRVES